MTEKQLAAIIARGKKRREKERVFSMNITREQGLYIQYRLKLKGKNNANIAREIGCSKEAVRQIIAGQKHSKRIEKVIADILGFKSWNSLVTNLRAKGAA